MASAPPIRPNPPQGAMPPDLRVRNRSVARFATLRSITALMLREMSTSYGRSPGGYVWAILEPLGAILILALGFSLVIHTPSLGSSFILFYATGFLPFNLYQGLALTIARAINFSRPLLFYPSVTWMDAVLARFILNSLTGILVAYLLLAGILAFSDTQTVLDLGPILMSLGLAMLLGLGVGLMNCALMGLVPVWDLIWSVVTRPLFLASGVLFLYEDMPIFAQNILWYNPLIHILGLFRSGFYPMYDPQYVSVTFVVFCGMATMVMGLVLLGRYHRDILNN